MACQGLLVRLGRPADGFARLQQRNPVNHKVEIFGGTLREDMEDMNVGRVDGTGEF